jgi:cell division protein FtsI/penicillin-binding protein 2
MGYGSKVDSTGKEVSGDSSFVQAVTGERIVGNTIKSIGLAKDKDGNIVETRATIEFKQSNGATVRLTLFEAKEDWQFDQINRTAKHLATKVVTEEQFYAAVANASDFPSFIKALSDLIMPASAGKVFTMKFVYNNGYVSVPKFPNWIAAPENADTLSTNAKYDKYTAEEATPAPNAIPATGDVF